MKFEPIIHYDPEHWAISFYAGVGAENPRSGSWGISLWLGPFQLGFLVTWMEGRNEVG